MTQDALSRRCDVSRQTIVALERQSHDPSLALALRIARALDADVGRLFRLHDERAPD